MNSSQNMLFKQRIGRAFLPILYVDTTLMKGISVNFCYLQLISLTTEAALYRHTSDCKCIFGSGGQSSSLQCMRYSLSLYGDSLELRPTFLLVAAYEYTSLPSATN